MRPAREARSTPLPTPNRNTLEPAGSAGRGSRGGWNERFSRTRSRSLPVGRSAAHRGSAHRGRADDPRHRARLCRSRARPPHPEGLSRGKDRPETLPADGRSGTARGDAAAGIRLRRRGLRRLRPHRARGRARQLRLPLDDERAELACHVPDPRLWRRRPAPQVSARPRARRAHRLLRAHRAERRLRSGRHDHAGRENRARLSAHRLENVDQQRADRRRVRGVGEVPRAQRPDSRLHSRKGHEGPFHAEDRRQAVVARLRSPARSCSTMSRRRRARFCRTLPA